MSYLLVGGGGFLGAIARYSLILIMARVSFGNILFSTIPVGTLIVNVLGCFLAGVMVGAGARFFPTDNPGYLAITIGFLGAFTTLSAVSVETITLFETQKFFLSFVNVGLNVFLGLLAAAIGKNILS